LLDIEQQLQSSKVQNGFGQLQMQKFQSSMACVFKVLMQSEAWKRIPSKPLARFCDFVPLNFPDHKIQLVLEPLFLFSRFGAKELGCDTSKAVYFKMTLGKGNYLA
jgi:hypothetical protein